MTDAAPAPPQRTRPRNVLRFALGRGDGQHAAEAAANIESGYAKIEAAAVAGECPKPEGLYLTAKYEWDVAPIARLLAKTRPARWMRFKYWWGCS